MVLWLAEVLAGEWRLTEGRCAVLTEGGIHNMFNKMTFLEFLKDDQGVVSVEYVLMVAAIGTILVVGVVALFNSMSDCFNTWANFFSGGN